ncbi:BQ2448_3812 [Microbotryum intermedium]|uniref:BQ2448_3812 protein n=1 Tax=Microbotryum intermedium TaxID=269621 RepID=A0A238FB25_9BASI|nr:BQ2448_3812 [Microbotryum intermedium]
MTAEALRGDRKDDEDEAERKVQFPAVALLPLMHHLLVKCRHMNGIVPTPDMEFLQGTPSYLSTILSNPLRRVNYQADWLRRIIPSLVQDHGEAMTPSSRLASAILKPQWADDAIESVKVPQLQCFGSKAASSTRTAEDEIRSFFHAADFKAFGHRLNDVLFDVELRILEPHKIPAGSFQTNGVGLHLGVMDVSRIVATPRSAPKSSRASTSIRATLVRVFQQATEKGHQSDQADGLWPDEGPHVADFKAFGHRLNDVLFDVERILEPHSEIPAGSFQTDGLRLHLPLMEFGE